MISVLVNWSYVFITTFIIGHFLLNCAYRFFKYEGKVRTIPSVACGLAATTMYAGFFSVFYKVGVAANVIMIIVCALFVFLEREDYHEMIGKLSGKNLSEETEKEEINKELKNKDTDNKETQNEKIIKIIKTVLIAVFFIWALFYTTEGQFFSDSGYYHEQSIRWIEEFGTVKGSVHILKRLAYNSLYFCQCALFSMRDLWGQSLHCLSGFYGIIVMIYAIWGMNRSSRTNVVRLAPIMYFVLWCTEITSPASDFPLWFAVFYVVIRWLELLDDEEESYVPYALLSVFVMFLVSIKLTVGLLVLIVIKPAVTMVKEKKVKEIIASIACGIVFIVPYFIRNYIICGWLIYPFTKIDIFNPDWKLPMEMVQSDADEIKVWGRGMGQIGGTAQDSISTWLPHWWEYTSVPNRRFIISFLIVAAVYVAYRIIKLILKFVLKDRYSDVFEKRSLGVIVLEISLVLSLAYWFIEGPLFRYGVGYILLIMFFMLGDMVHDIWKKEKAVTDLIIVVCIACMVPSIKSLKEYMDWNIEVAKYYCDYKYFVVQEDYPRVEYATTEINGITFYYPAEELGEIGYHIFPALWYSGTEGIESRGDSIEDGYRYKENK